MRKNNLLEEVNFQKNIMESSSMLIRDLEMVLNDKQEIVKEVKKRGRKAKSKVSQVTDIEDEEMTNAFLEELKSISLSFDNELNTIDNSIKVVENLSENPIKKQDEESYTILATNKNGKKGRKTKNLKINLYTDNKENTKSKKSHKKRKSIFKGYKLSKIGDFFSSKKKFFLNTALVTISVMVVSFTSYAAYSYLSINNNDTLESLSHLAILPTGEKPKVYIIQSEKNELLKNPLFSEAKVGDNIISYEKTGKVYIYRGSEGKIVNIININSN